MNAHEQGLPNLSLVRRIGLVCTAMLLATLGVSLTGCNTTEGVGKDIQEAGDAIEDAAD